MKRRPGTRGLRSGERLTQRQQEVVRMLERGLTNGQIATELGISLDDAKFHVTELMNRYGVHSREEAVIAWRGSRPRALGWITIGPVFWSGAVAAGVLGIVLSIAVFRAWEVEPLSGIFNSTNATDGPNSARFTMHTRIETPGKSPIDSVASGEIDFEHMRMAFRGPDGVEQVFVGSLHYQRSSPSSQWRKFPNSSGTGVASFTSDYWMDRLKTAREVEDLGVEVVRGETAQHYRFISDYPVSPGAQPAVGNMYNDTDLYLDLWLASGDRVVQLEQRFTFKNSGDAELEGQSTYLRVELSRWNEPVDVREPDPSEVDER